MATTTILDKKEPVPTLENNKPVKVKVSGPPKIEVTASVTKHPDYVEKSSDYVSRMFGSHK